MLVYLFKTGLKGEEVHEWYWEKEDDTSAINKSEINLEVGKVLWKLHISWICNCL